MYEHTTLSGVPIMSGSIIDHDELIIRMLATDDDQAIKILFDQYYVLLNKVAMQLVRDPGASNDLVQELFIAIWTKRHSIKLHKPLAHYLVKSTMNRALNYIRNRARSKEFSIFSFKDFENTLLSNPADTSLLVSDIKALWDLAASKMTPRTRVVFMLSRDQGMSYKEIAAHLGISVKAVEKNLTQALRILREVFKAY